MNSRLSNSLQTLSAAPRDEHPLLSIYLDWSVDSSGRRQSLAALDQELARHSAALGERGPARDSFEADRARLAAYLAAEVPDEARGVAVFACDAHGIWVTLPLMVPVETHVACDGYPHLFELARVLDDHETFVVALAEGQQAQVFVMSADSLQHVDSTEAREGVNRVQAGGWSQLRYERHVGYVIQLHMNDLAATLQDAVQRYGASHIVILTNDSVKGHVRQALPPQLHELVVDMLPYERNVDVEQIFVGLSPRMAEVERSQEEALLGTLETQLATKGGLAFAGEKDVAQALLKGQVDTLLISPAYSGQGGECPTCGVLRPGQRQSCPYDGSQMLPVDLREAMVLHTLRQSGRVEVVGIEGALEGHGNIAALLRYRDDVQSAVGDGIA